MSGWLYWLLALVGFGLVCMPWVCARLEDRADRRDREAWQKVAGSL